MDYKEYYYQIVEKEETNEKTIKNFLTKNKIQTKGTDIPNPILSFESLNLPEFLRENLQCYTEPTPIQSVAWPIVFKGRDLVGIAQTGSGKTLSFVLPILLYLKKMKRKKSENRSNPRALVLAPTRELAQQINEVVETFTKGSKIKSCVVYGGKNRYANCVELQKRVDILIATPGRLNDLLSTGETTLSDCHFLVLDEADRMLDMGFEPQIRKIINQITSPDRHTLMWSATWPKLVQRLANEFLSDNIHLRVGAETDDLTANTSIRQIVSVCRPTDKMNKLLAILKQIGDEKAIIFGLTKKGVDNLCFSLQKMKYDAIGIHGSKSQTCRESILNKFKNDQLQFLVATDVAARGLDVDDVKYVINYDFPLTIDNYIHRIGRTGRRGRTGTAYTFFTKGDAAEHVNELIAILKTGDQEICPELLELKESGIGNPKYGAAHSYGRGKMKFDGDMPKAKHIKFS